VDIGKILVVDDSDTQRSMHKEMLEDAGYAVIEAVNGKEGIEKALSEVPDIVLSDIAMPVMDGLEMTKKLKQDEAMKYIPIICVSASYQDIATKVKALLDAGAEEYFYNEQPKEELIVKVAVMMRIRRLYLDLLEKNKQLKIFNDAAVGRELKMAELKKKNKELEAELLKYKK